MVSSSARTSEPAIVKLDESKLLVPLRDTMDPVDHDDDWDARVSAVIDEILDSFDEFQSRDEVSAWVFEHPKFSVHDARAWIRVGFVKEEALAWSALEVGLSMAREMRSFGIEGSVLLKYESWLTRFSVREVARWYEVGLQPGEQHRAELFADQGINPPEAKVIYQLVGRARWALLKLLVEVGVPLSVDSVTRWRDLDPIRTTPSILLSLIDRGFPSAQESLGFERVDWEYEEVASLASELGLGSPQDMLKQVGLEGVDDLLKLVRSGFEPGDALEWVREGFSISEVSSWIASFPSAREAAAWRRIQLSPRAAKLWFDRGVTDPAEAHEWINTGFSDSDFIDWRVAAFRPAEAATWKRLGVSPTVARRRVNQGLTPR